MDTASELRSAVNNMKFYNAKINELAKLQLNKDYNNAKITGGMNPAPGELRFDSLGIISATCSWIETYLECIENMIKRAEEQDGKLIAVGGESENQEG